MGKSVSMLSAAWFFTVVVIDGVSSGVMLGLSRSGVRNWVSKEGGQDLRLAIGESSSAWVIFIVDVSIVGSSLLMSALELATGSFMGGSGAGVSNWVSKEGGVRIWG